MSFEFEIDVGPPTWDAMSWIIANPPEVSTITAHDVFPREVQTADDIRRDIALLTIANLEVTKSLTCSAKSAVKNLSSDMRIKSAMLSDISTLLTIGLPTSVNAVTGRIDPDGVTIVCASSEPERRVTGQARTVVRKVAVDPLEGKRLLYNWESLPDLPMDSSFDTHVAQVGSILAYVWGLEPSERFVPSVGAQLLNRFNLFITGRARHRILARVKYAHELWGSSPFRVMRTWYENNLHAVHPLIVKFRAVEGKFVSMLAAKNIHPEPGQPKHYMLSSSNILAWMDILEDVLNSIKEAFEQADAPIIHAALAILQLDNILKSDLSVVLQKHGVHTALRSAYPTFLSIHGRRKANEESAAHPDHDAQQPAGSGKVDPDDYGDCKQ
ncbi:hypothetical protein FKP32DRAFT_1454184 [Trametes sanguinea]|nr:hypothetical protein FKP32DRAFT_1454184 [Trametes sanguinea]